MRHIFKDTFELNSNELTFTAKELALDSKNKPCEKSPKFTLTEKDKELFVAYGLGPKIAPRFPTIAKAIAHQVANHPNMPAVECEGETITYQTLDQLANRLANQLQYKGVQRGDAVCLYLYRSIPLIAGILACMKLGASYVPQHVGVAPKESLRYIAKTTKANLILTLSHLADQIPVEAGQELIFIDEIIYDERLEATFSLELNLGAEPDDVCMILFTSGTTGIPNGVQVTHKNLCNILQTSPGDLDIKPGMKVGQILSIAFDMAAWEILGCLSNGGCLVIRGKDIQETAEKVNVLIATPSILNTIDPKKCENLQVAIVAGEPCPRPLADLWSSYCNFYNSCGPTETTIINTAAQHFLNKEVLSIGRPTPNNTVYILDEDLNPLPIGEKGEMWAGGDCVTAGYLANDALNEERYKDDPFLSEGRKMFKTRDLGRWTDRGELEHWGRVDDMVKIRGFRVELDGVSNVIERCKACEQAVTLKYDERSLVAFVSPQSVNVDKAKQMVKDALPYYAVPEHVIALPELPKTARGKIDKRALMELAEEHFTAQKSAKDAPLDATSIVANATPCAISAKKEQV